MISRWLTKARTLRSELNARPSFRRSVFGCLLTFVAVLASVTPLSHYAENQVGRRWLFGFRSFVGADPALSPRLKIFAVDDSTLAYLGGSVPSLDHWANVLTALARSEPKAVFFDKLFDLVAESEEAKRRFVDRVKALPFPVYALAFVPNRAIAGRPPLDARSFALPGLSPPRDLAVGLPAYGPSPGVVDAFAGVGNIVHEGLGRFRALTPVKTGDGAKYLPLVAFFAAEQFSGDSHGVSVNQTTLPLDSDGLVLTNSPHPRTMERSIFGLRTVFEYAHARKKIVVVKPGDVVVILPGMHTGAGDRINGPHGTVPGGHLFSSLINSVLTGRWLKVGEFDALLVLLGGLLGTVLAQRVRRLWVVLSAGGAVILGFLLAAAAFLLADLVVPFLVPGETCATVCLVVFCFRLLDDRVEELRMQSELASAQAIQDRFFPPKVEQLPGLNLLGHHAPSAECSGDFWTRWDLGGGKYRVLIGDAMGHGAPAALLSAQAHSCVELVKSLTAQQRLEIKGPGDLLALLNQVIFQTYCDSMLMTMVVLDIDTVRRELVWSGAAHPLPLLLAKERNDARFRPGNGGSLTMLPNGIVPLRFKGNILGTDPASKFKESRVALAPGDRIVLHTDGLTEAGNAAGKPYGNTRLRRILGELTNETPAKIQTGLLADVRSFGGVIRPIDDLTLIVLEILPEVVEKAA